MKNYLLIALAAGALTSCTQDPNWYSNCERNYSEDGATKADCKAAHPEGTSSATGGVGLRDDISGGRSDESTFHRHEGGSYNN